MGQGLALEGMGQRGVVVQMTGGSGGGSGERKGYVGEGLGGVVRYR